MKLTDNAEMILKERYYQPGEDWEKLCRRVSNFIDIDGNYKEEFFNILYNTYFLPNSPTLMNAGTKIKNLSACFVLPIPDNIEGIYDTLKHAAMIHATGGGTGFDFSELRPNGSIVKSTNGTTSGPISFLQVFDASTNIIKQGGKRRGANMAVMRIDHPDIEEFISCKHEEGKISNFNISVALTNKFIEACLEDTEFTLDYNTHNLKIKTVKARDLLNKIIHGMWKNGEPGILFIDTVNRNKNEIDEWIASTNPCGEIPLPAYGSCNLGSIDVSKFVNEDKYINYDFLDKVISLAVRFLDNVITQNEYVIPQIKEKALLYRPIGLGVMGWADFLIKLDIEYGSDESIELAEFVMNFISSRGKHWSNELLKERGPNAEGKNRRNATVTSIAPTGTLSTIANCSSGIEPNFAWEYTANRIDKELQYFHPLAKIYLENNKRLPEYFVTAQEIEPIKHVRMQAAFQKFVDNSISKTINLPFKTTTDEIQQILFDAWESGCKGLTIYRDGSRQKQVLVKKEELVSKCPSCGSKLNHAGGCLECSCGWSACSL